MMIPKINVKFFLHPKTPIQYNTIRNKPNQAQTRNDEKNKTVNHRL